MNSSTRLSARVLFVEDDVDIRETLTELLRDEGHEVVDVETAEQGLAQLALREFEIVLTDYNLPGHSGTWLIDQAKQTGCLHRAVPLLLTASSHLDGAEGLRILKKPIEIDVLCREIAAATERASKLLAPLPAAKSPDNSLELVLFVHGGSPSARRSVDALSKILEAYEVPERALTVVDVSTAAGIQQAEHERVAFTPTLMRVSPSPRRWVVGDLRHGAAVARLLRESGARKK